MNGHLIEYAYIATALTRDPVSGKLRSRGYGTYHGTVCVSVGAGEDTRLVILREKMRGELIRRSRSRWSIRQRRSWSRSRWGGIRGCRWGARSYERERERSPADPDSQ